MTSVRATAICLSITFFLSLHQITLQQQISEISRDVQAPPGDNASLYCRVDRNLENQDEPDPACAWIAPDRTRLVPEGYRNRIRVSVEKNLGNFICYLDIISLEIKDGGPWNCVLTSANREISGKYIFVQVIEEQKILSHPTNLIASEHGSINMMCPTTIRPTGAASRPVCIWIEPSGRKIDLVGRNGEIYQHVNYDLYGDPDRGDCGIKVKKVDESHAGTWKCRILPKFTDDTLQDEITLQLVRSAGVSSSFTELKKEFVESFVLNKSDTIYNAYWILRRDFVLLEGAHHCFEKDNNGMTTCVESSYLSPTEMADRIVKFTVNLSYSQVAEEDMSEPVVLVLEWRDMDNEDRVKTRFVDTEFDEWKKLAPFSEPNKCDSIAELNESKSEEAADGFDHQCPTGCKINGYNLDAGERRTFSRECLLVRCISDGEMSVRPLPKCRRRKVSIDENISRVEFPDEDKEDKFSEETYDDDDETFGFPANDFA